MNSTRRQARIAGSLYLSTSILGFFGLLYAPSHFIVQGDAAATASLLLVVLTPGKPRTTDSVSIAAQGAA